MDTPIELHNYYVCNDGNIKGIEIYSRDFITIRGPFTKYDATKHILSNQYVNIYLPRNYADKTILPPVYQRTCELLNRLCAPEYP